MSDLSEAAKRIGLNNPTTMKLLHTFSPIAARQAERMERTTLRGRSLGLTDDETREVIDTWNAWYRVRPFEFSWEIVDQALVMRSMGEEWRPPKGFERSLAAAESFRMTMEAVASSAALSQAEIGQLRDRALEVGREEGRS